MRKRIFEIIELVGARDDVVSHAYDIGMIVVIAASLVPLMFKHSTPVFTAINYGATSVFIVDYLLRLTTADYKLGRGWTSILLYPFTFMAIVDLVAILPTFSLLGEGFRTLRVLRLLQAMRVFRALKIFRYSKDVEIIARVMRRQKESLYAVCALAIGYVLLCALVVFNVEPDTFDDFFEAVYWATISLTTMGYGDIYPLSTVGRVVTMVSSIIGIAVVALPAGIITAGYMTEIQKRRTVDEENEE